VLGQGTWGLAEDAGRRRSEIAALRHGLDLGMTVIDTAEMYADGAAEELVGEALGARRDEAFLVSKVLPGNATRRGTIAACERSLGRLRTDRIDLYLLHWRTPGVRLEDALEGFAELQAAGMIRSWGVSNFDVSDLRELERLPGGAEVATDQVLYNLLRRGIECDLMHWSRARRLPIMAYSPLDQGRLLDHPGLQAVADRYGASPAQLALAWVLRRDGVIAIPRAGVGVHVDENRAALKIKLTERDIAELDRDFPPPEEPRPLEML
jgi:diketogulonate reductase-like aldo/keto reductase